MATKRGTGGDAPQGQGLNYPYTSIAKDQPTGARTTRGVDNWGVVGGQPGGGSTPTGKNTNMGKQKGQY